MTTTLRLSIIVLCHGFVRYTLSCMESRGTVDVVEFCPRNRSEWFQASQRKNCSSIQHSCESFVYHCVINPFVNELLEVCAPRRNILGNRCAEYNYEGGLVQYNRLASCVNHTVPCEFGYSSDEAYKYQECYKLVPLNKASLKTTPSRNENKISSNMPTDEEHYSSTSKPHLMERCEEVHSSSVELAICLGVAVITAFIEAVVLFSCWRRMKLQNETKDPMYTAVELEDLSTSNERNRTASSTSNIGRKTKYQIVAAIDVGATYTGSAYSSTQSPFEIITSPIIPGKRVSTKTKSAVLLDKDGKLLQFGFDSTVKYYERSLAERQALYYFDKLHALTGEMKLQDKAGKTMKSTEVLGKYMEGIMRLLKFMIGKKYELERTLFVITIPNDWYISKESVMIEAATLAGIPKHQLEVIREADAIPCFFRDFTKFQKEGCICYRFDTKEPLLTDSMSYIVLDLGGTRADIVVFQHHKSEGEVHIIPWLKDSIPKRFSVFISTLIGNASFKELTKTDYEGYIGMLREIEERITAASSISPGISIKVPSSMQNIVGKITKANMATVVDSASAEYFKGGVSYTNSQLAICPNIFPGYFIDNAIKKFTSKLHSLFEGESPTIDINNINLVLMVGGYSNITLMQSAMRDFSMFKGKPIVVPKNAELAVLQGAVLKGHARLV